MDIHFINGTKKYVRMRFKKKGKPSSHFRHFDGLYLSSISQNLPCGQLWEDDQAMENTVDQIWCRKQ